MGFTELHCNPQCCFYLTPAPARPIGSAAVPVPLQVASRLEGRAEVALIEAALPQNDGYHLTGVLVVDQSCREKPFRLQKRKKTKILK